MRNDNVIDLCLKAIRRAVLRSLTRRACYYDMDDKKDITAISVVGNGDEAFRVTLKGKSVTYGTNNTDSQICNLTSEAFPRMTNYINNTYMKRPSLGELHGDYNLEKSFTSNFEEIPEQSKNTEESGHVFKLGWIQGVLIPCLLNIWGVMLFLRMPWIVAQSGIFESIVIIVISTGICGLTTLSLSALCTNGEVKGGGIYFIISRSLGPEFGASVGIVLAFANAVSASLNTIGFCESFNDLLLKNYNTTVLDNETDSIRLVGIIAILVMIFICALGIEWESKAQNFLIAFINIAMVDFFIGTILGPQNDKTKIAQGFEGLSWDLVTKNWNNNYRPVEGTNHQFFTIFAIFFPSVTGIQAGANISGDLKDPSSAIPKGTLLSLLISMISYILVVVFSGAAAIRDASGNVSEVDSMMFTNCTNRICKYGLHNDYSIMQIMSVWGILIYIGCFAATLSTALTNLLTVPRLIKALGDDHIYPGLAYFSKEYGPNKEPFRGYVLTFFLSSAFVLIAKLNDIAPLISNFYLASYALINFCTFHAALVEPLGWRPTFKCYNKWLSLISCILCVFIMVFIDWKTSIATFVVFFTLYLLVMYRQPDVNWGSSTQAQMYKATLASSYKLINIDEHVKNYQPHILLLSGQPNMRPALLDLANLITKNSALLICANLVSDKLSYKRRRALLQENMLYLSKRKIKAFFTIVDGMKFEEGTKAIMQCCGIGKLCPNIVMMGYKKNWMTSKDESLQIYFNVLHNAFDNRLAVAILRMPKSLEIPKIKFNSGNINAAFTEDSMMSCNNSSDINLTEIRVGTMPKESPSPLRRSMCQDLKTVVRAPVSEENCENALKKYSELPPTEISKQMTIFSRKLKNGVIDVWWLYDDGGLTMLLPYILNTRTIWSNSSLRIFTLASDPGQVNEEEKNMADLLAKFRINYASLQMLTDVEKPEGRETRQLFDELLKPYKLDSKSPNYVSDDELRRLEDKTNRQLRLKELLIQYSKNSDLVVMSLPMPRKGVVSAPVYLAWLEVLTCNMPPFFLVRGNQTSVLTFYS